MEQKKIKKLLLKKETISNLSSFEQNRILGGYNAPSLIIMFKECAEWHSVNEGASFCNPSYCNDLSCAGGPNTCYQGGNCDSTDDPDVGCHTDRYC